MSFTSFAFILFLATVITAYFFLPHRFRVPWLLVASCYLYATFVPAYLAVILLLIVIDYSSGILMRTYRKRKKTVLAVSIAANLGILFLFKYFDFMNANVAALAGFLNLHYPVRLLELALPLGISFHTFQSLGYVIEVYRGRQRPERNFFTYALYVMFFPQLAAGPIERPGHMLPQFRAVHRFSADRLTEGLRRILFGMFKKMIVADRLAVIVNHVYGSPQDFIGAPLVIATVAFAFQIYCDFSGYTDIAVGTARIMGFSLTENFTRPYFSASVTEFWRRWHRSLSSWFRDYVYIPLGGNRGGTLLTYRNVMVTFLLSGLWHGAGWLFVIWGGLHGTAIVAERILQPIADRYRARINPTVLRVLSTVYTFSFVCTAWVFFRARTFADARYIISASVRGWGAFAANVFRGNADGLSAYVFRQGSGLGADTGSLTVLGMSLILLGIIDVLYGRNAMLRISRRVRWSLYVIVILFMLNFGTIERVPFIYFQF